MLGAMAFALAAFDTKICEDLTRKNETLYEALNRLEGMKRFKR
jgi:hypothetical protein